MKFNLLNPANAYEDHAAFEQDQAALAAHRASASAHAAEMIATRMQIAGEKLNDETPAVISTRIAHEAASRGDQITGDFPRIQL